MLRLHPGAGAVTAPSGSPAPQAEKAPPAAARAVLRLIELAVAGALAAMLVLTVLNVILRYAFDSGIAEAEEVAVVLLVWVTFLGAVTALARNEHLGIDLLASAGRPVQAVAALLSGVMMIAISALLVWGSVVQFEINLVNTMPVSGLSQSVLYAAALAGGVGMLVVLLARLPGQVRDVLRAPAPAALIADDADGSRDTAAERAS